MNYNWEAEFEGGEIVNESNVKSGNLTGCVRFSLMPKYPSLPQHDIVGVKFKKRFIRVMQRFLGSKEKTILHCIVIEGSRIYVNDATGALLITPEDYELYL